MPIDGFLDGLGHLPGLWLIIGATSIGPCSPARAVPSSLAQGEPAQDTNRRFIHRFGFPAALLERFDPFGNKLRIVLHGQGVYGMLEGQALLGLGIEDMPTSLLAILFGKRPGR